MKKSILLFVLTVVVTLAGCGVKKTQMVSQTYLVVDTIISTNLSQKEAFQKASEWVATAYNSAQDVVQLSDSESATIIGKGAFNHNYGSSMKYGNVWGTIHYTLIVKCKDGRMRITVQDFKHEAQNKTMISKDLGLVNTGAHPEWGHVKFIKEYWSDLQRYCKEYSLNIIDNIKSELDDKEDDNW